MSILVEALSVVIPRHVLDAGYPGGTEGYLETARRARGARYAISDERLACVSFASPADADAFTAPLSALGLDAEDGLPPPVACLDEDFGPTAACPWLRWRRHEDGFTSCWLEWTEPGELAAPPDWLPPRQRSQAGRPTAARPASPPPGSADVAPAASETSAVGHDTPPPLRIVPAAIGPLTPISSPAVLAAMEGNSVSNGHALLDADSIDVDSLVASADDVFADIAYGNVEPDVADQEIGDDWSLPEFESSDDDATVDGQATADEANDDADDFSSDAERVEAVGAERYLAVDEDSDEDSVDVQETAATEDVVASENASPFGYPSAIQDLSPDDDLMASQEAFAEDAAAMEGASPFDYSPAVQDAADAEDVAAGAYIAGSEDEAESDDAESDDAEAAITVSEVTSAVEESVIDERTFGDGTMDPDDDDDDDDDATSYLAEDDMSYDDQADVDALVTIVAQSSKPADVDAPIWTDEIEEEPPAAPDHQVDETFQWADVSTAAFDEVDSLFAARNVDTPIGPDEQLQSVASASPDDDATAHIPASLTPVAMTAVSVAPSPVAVSSSDSPLDAVSAHLAERGWRYSQDAEQGALFYQSVGGRASYPGFAAADESAQLVWLYTQIPVRVPEHRRAAAVELLTRANHGLAVGNFEFDYTDGEVRFKAVADSADGCFSAAAAGRLLSHSLEACDRYHDSLMQVIYGGLSPADAVR